MLYGKNEKIFWNYKALSLGIWHVASFTLFTSTELVQIMPMGPKWHCHRGQKGLHKIIFVRIWSCCHIYIYIYQLREWSIERHASKYFAKGQLSILKVVMLHIKLMEIMLRTQCSQIFYSFTDRTPELGQMFISFWSISNYKDRNVEHNASKVLAWPFG